MTETDYRRRLDRDLACELWLSGQFRSVTALARRLDFSRQAVAEALVLRGLSKSRRKVKRRGWTPRKRQAEIVKLTHPKGDAYFQERLEAVYGPMLPFQLRGSGHEG
jgi:hypothetical protein